MSDLRKRLEDAQRDLGVVKKERDDARHLLERISLLVIGAAKCGFANDQQREALVLAMEAFSGEDRLLLSALMDITPRNRL